MPAGACCPRQKTVALLAEGVDRNLSGTHLPIQPGAVALLAEGVDRNDYIRYTRDGAAESPSSRRAWIEMSPPKALQCCSRVALLAEGVDRNNGGAVIVYGVTESPSSRRAWIEI